MYEEVNLILDFIEKHLYEDIKLDDICRLVNYSKSHISRMFNKYIGLSLPKYVTKRRLSNAAIMIYNTDKPIGYIADVHGFGTDKYFSTLFKKELGISPLNYRKRNGYIYLFPKRILKGGSVELMKNLEDIVCQINVNSDSNGEVKAELTNIQRTNDGVELAVSVSKEMDGKATVEVTLE
ncbi:MAG: AraC family transcriptional regulator [Candidatus Izemoplasmatales bacterium]|jgi:AraC-like DNA-binding protein